MSSPFVAILMGSDSDIPVMQAGMDVLNKLDVPFEARITSAHRTPDDTRAYVEDADARGCVVFIAGAGMAAHLAGAVAAHTMKPVIGIPIDSGPLQGLDALLSTVQMPGGVPVATVSIGRAGAKNAAYLAAQIMAISDEKLTDLLMQDRKSNTESIQEKSRSLQNSLTAKQ
jgi:5-(carboxyamino)imidazole ribonucleotide mutase|tara:strand:- start:1202 stop:1714 length:513 start_codon:yes stop_codon:yes gene_type:complete